MSLPLFQVTWLIQNAGNSSPCGFATRTVLGIAFKSGNFFWAACRRAPISASFTAAGSPRIKGPRLSYGGVGAISNVLTQGSLPFC